MTLMPGSFRNRLALLCGGLALIVGLPAYLYINHVYAEQLLNERGHAIHELATAMSAVLAESLNERRREIELLSDTRLFRREPLDDSAFRGSLERLQKSYPQYSWIGVADLDGVVQAATHDLLLGQNVAQRPWFAGGLDGVFIGDLHEALLLAKLLPKKGSGPMRFIDIAVPVSGEDGQLRGVLAAHVHWDWADSVLRVLRPSNAERVGMDILIINGQGDVIYPEDSPLAVPRPSGRPTRPGFFIDNWSGSTAYVTSMVPVREIIETSPLGWQVVIRQPLDRVMEDVVALRKVVLVFALLAVTILLLLSWVVASRLSQPLERLATLARRIEKGDEGVTLEVGAGSVELRHLVDALRGMAATLIQRREALEASNRDLEHKVAERTAELARLNDELRDQARRDALTGLPNRLAANERLRDEFVRMRRSRKGYAVLVADIDHFKRINDSHGHPAGDAVLRHVAAVLKAALRESDFVARFGGEEFLLLLPATSVDDACRVGEKIRRAVEASPTAAVGVVTMSIGLAMAQPDHEDEDAAVRLADAMLYEAKRAGRNRLVSEQIQTADG
ncbi:MAG: diguanylate cyclase [Methyloversatilis sp.]|uniref:sensor domain-containing diguanylate cyclase n=1 Tax=Methyloversatilis sp. TaxID=2569862 RepID=UPI0025E630CA|nr:diguanylate cyclase [Methyloversatilis sp.]MCR6667788.1 diguanylate cyclase [Methyloversatilis sp.]